MACNSCSKSFSILRKEKGCPACGFSYCSHCLKYKKYVPKLNSEAKVCKKCDPASNINEKKNIDPPDAYFKRIGIMDDKFYVNNSSSFGNSLNPVSGSSKDQEISDRLQKLKEDNIKSKVTTEDIADRLVKIKGEVPSTSDAELQLRLANLRGVPVSNLQDKPFTVLPDNRTEQEQVDDLLKQYTEKTSIDGNYQNEFQGVIDNIAFRLQQLKKTDHKNTSVTKTTAASVNVESDDEEVLNEIIEKAKAESRLQVEVSDPQLDELPFCEICNEDANMRCCGCKYLFCKQCFIEHKDEDDGCDKYDQLPSTESL